MTDISTSELRFSRYYRQFSNNYAFSKRTLLVLALPLLSVNLTLDFGRAAGNILEWFYVSAAGYLALILAALLMKKIFETRKIHSGFYLVSYYVLGLVRGAVIYMAGQTLGLFGQDELTYRLLGSATYVFCVMPITTILVSNFGRANSTLKALQAQTIRRAKRLNSMKLEIAEQKSEVASRVNGLLMPVLTDLINRVNAAKGSDIAKQIAGIRATVDDVVRPLSQSVAGEASRLSDPQVELDRASLLARLNPKTRLNVSQLILPGLSTFLITLMCSSPVITFGGYKAGLLVLICMAISIFVVLKIAKALSQNLRLRALPSFLIVISVYEIISLLVVGSIFIIDDSLVDIAAARLTSLNLFFGIAFFVAQSRYQLLQQSSAALEEVNLELELLNAQAKQELWHNRRRIATVLHGPVQAALYSSAIRLTQAKRPSKKLLQEVNLELANALAALNFEQNEFTSVRTVIREIIDVWSGVCEIYFNVPKNVYDTLKRNPNAAESFVEITREAVSNAIKHGGATEIEVTAKLARGVISLQVTNNGKKPSKQQASTGYGTQILNELALRWTLDQPVSGKVTFSAEIVANV